MNRKKFDGLVGVGSDLGFGAELAGVGGKKMPGLFVGFPVKAKRKVMRATMLA